ncbi:uncharacterized protein EAF02_002646 [Botrytis sinoallii]|uniref:uncharacterized protein n=1 Tax=Botrytis sinoallii TaxID=1463999 RepID=UPI0018FF977C|nr:uncharacterized protein EAF02_002646 [Botrytis sinoallii]KAF7888105.1 hypothetical protein EAF02_002646 [Botrytis sinoallii]
MHRFISSVTKCSKNARGQAPVKRAAQAYAEQKAAENVATEQQKEAQKLQAQQAKAQQLVQEKALALQRVFNFDYTTLPKHAALKVVKDGGTGTVKLHINIDIIHHQKTINEANLNVAISKYADLITKIELRLVAPTYHESSEVYNLRVRNMMQTINCLNKFQIDEFQFVVSLSNAFNFNQMKLAASAFGLKFKDLTMVTEILHVKGRFNVDIGSPWDRRLAGLYKAEFFVHKEK